MLPGRTSPTPARPGYIREQLNLSPAGSYAKGSVILGTGVSADGVRQQIDKFLETRVNTALGDQAATQSKSNIYTQLEGAIAELGDSDLSTSISNFQAALQNVANEPDNVPLRQQLISQAGQLASDVQGLYGRVTDLRQQQNSSVGDLVDRANQLIDQIDKLNPQIVKTEVSGLLQSDAGSLRSQRYAALQELSQIAPITYRERADGGVDILTANSYLLLDGSKQHLETYTVADRDSSVDLVRTSGTKTNLPSGGGQINGVIAGRDSVLGGFTDDLNAIANAIIGQVNAIHSSGEGLVGRQTVTAERGVGDPAATLDAAGLPFAVKHGGFDVTLVNSQTGERTTTRVAVDLDGLGGDDATLNSLAASLNGVGNLTATTDASGKLTLAAADGYTIAFGNDSSGALAALGINTLFTGSNAANIAVQADVQKDQRLLATGRGGTGDNSNIAALTQAFDSAGGTLGGQSVRQFYEATVSAVGQQSAAESAVAEGSSAYLDSLMSQREQYSGVSLDEEAIKLMEFQHAFQASARIVTTVDELYNVLLNM